MKRENQQYKERNSNIEFLRIVAMLMIISYHYSIHSGFDFGDSISANRVFIDCFSMFGKLGVNIFVIISGYYGIRQEFKLNRVIRLQLQTLFYSLLGLLFGIAAVGNVDFKLIIKSIFPVIFNQYWFITAFTVLMLFEPFLNILLRTITRKKFLLLVGLITVIWCIIPMLSFQKMDGFNWTQQIWVFCTYIYGAYIGLYSKKLEKYRGKIKFITTLSLFFLPVSVLLIYFSSFFNQALIHHATFFRWSNTLPVLFGSLGLVFTFISCPYRDNITVNRIASSAIGVYLFHENIFLSTLIFGRVIKAASIQNSVFLVIHACMSVIIIYMLGILVDFIWKSIYKIIKNKIEIVSEKIQQIIISWVADDTRED